MVHKLTPSGRTNEGTSMTTWVTRSRQRCLTILAAGALAAATLFGPGGHAPQASAAPNSLVAFGDSTMANPKVLDWLNSKLGGGSPMSSGLGSSNNITNNCAQDPNNFAKRTAAMQGLVPWDYSCSGATASSGGKLMSQQVDEAVRDGALSPGTRQVIIQMGFNDTHANLTRNTPHDVIAGNYVNVMAAQVDRIRHHAPHAQIKIIGYPSISDNVGTCLLQLGNNVHTFERLDVLIGLENLTERMQRDLAARTNTQFVDVRNQSMGHGMCAPDGQRWFGALIDLGQPRNMPVHMSDLGNHEVAGIIARS